MHENLNSRQVEIEQPVYEYLLIFLKKNYVQQEKRCGYL